MGMNVQTIRCLLHIVEKTWTPLRKLFSAPGVTSSLRAWSRYCKPLKRHDAPKTCSPGRALTMKSNTTYTQARRQELAAGGAKNHKEEPKKQKGGPHF